MTFEFHSDSITMDSSLKLTIAQLIKSNTDSISRHLERAYKSGSPGFDALHPEHVITIIISNLIMTLLHSFWKPHLTFDMKMESLNDLLCQIKTMATEFLNVAELSTVSTDIVN